MKKLISATLTALLLIAMLIPCFAFTGSALDATSIPATDEALTVDGVKEDVYSLGKIYASSFNDKATNYDGTSAFTASLLWDGKGKTYCFVEVIDSDIVVNDDLWKKAWWHCDSWQAYIDFGAKGANADNSGKGTQWTFVADLTGKYKQTAAPEYKVVLTDNGFNVEFAFDNNGTAFKEGDKFGFGPYLNACHSYTDASLGNGKGYKKCTVSVSFANSEDPTKYVGPAAKNYDALVLSAEKVTTIKPEDTPPVVNPDTGDNGFVFIALTVIALAGTAVVVTCNKRRGEF